MRVAFGAINNGTDRSTGTNGTSSVVSLVQRHRSPDLLQRPLRPCHAGLRHAAAPGLDDVGQYFSLGPTMPARRGNTGSSSGTQYACRQNFNILMTDGY